MAAKENPGYYSRGAYHIYFDCFKISPNRTKGNNIKQIIKNIATPPNYAKVKRFVSVVFVYFSAISGAYLCRVRLPHLSVHDDPGLREQSGLYLSAVPGPSGGIHAAVPSAGSDSGDPAGNPAAPAVWHVVRYGERLLRGAGLHALLGHSDVYRHRLCHSVHRPPAAPPGKGKNRSTARAGGIRLLRPSSSLFYCQKTPHGKKPVRLSPMGRFPCMGSSSGALFSGESRRSEGPLLRIAAHIPGQISNPVGQHELTEKISVLPAHEGKATASPIRAVRLLNDQCIPGKALGQLLPGQAAALLQHPEKGVLYVGIPGDKRLVFLPPVSYTHLTLPTILLV